jgi:hypothetical protein
MKRQWILATFLALLVLTLAACAQPAANTPEQAIRTWLDTWTQMNLDNLLKLTTPGFQAEAKAFYGHEFAMFSKISYKDLSTVVLEDGSQGAKVQADFLVELETPSTTPALASTVIRNAVRQIFNLTKDNSSWLVSAIERTPL